MAASGMTPEPVQPERLHTSRRASAPPSSLSVALLRSSSTVWVTGSASWCPGGAGPCRGPAFRQPIPADWRGPSPAPAGPRGHRRRIGRVGRAGRRSSPISTQPGAPATDRPAPRSGLSSRVLLPTPTCSSATIRPRALAAADPAPRPEFHQRSSSRRRSRWGSCSTAPARREAGARVNDQVQRPAPGRLKILPFDESAAAVYGQTPRATRRPKAQSAGRAQTSRIGAGSPAPRPDRVSHPTERGLSRVAGRVQLAEA